MGDVHSDDLRRTNIAVASLLKALVDKGVLTLAEVETARIRLQAQIDQEADALYATGYQPKRCPFVVAIVDRQP